MCTLANHDCKLEPGHSGLFFLAISLFCNYFYGRPTPSRGCHGLLSTLTAASHMHGWV